MMVEIEIRCGIAPFYDKPTKLDMQKNIDALKRAIDGKPLACDMILLMDTKSILEGIQSKLPST